MPGTPDESNAMASEVADCTVRESSGADADEVATDAAARAVVPEPSL